MAGAAPDRPTGCSDLRGQAESLEGVTRVELAGSIGATKTNTGSAGGAEGDGTPWGAIALAGGLAVLAIGVLALVTRSKRRATPTTT